SDPGYELIRAAIARSHPVVPIPGPSALISALVASGLPADSFLYLGFLPRKSSERRKLFAEVANEKRTLVTFEAPHRLLDSLADARSELGDRPCAVARELTKVFEEVFRGTLSEAISHFTATPLRGEITVVIAGAPEEAAVKWDEARVRAELATLMDGGMDRKTAAKAVAERSGWGRREVYALEIKPR
ncbi:MAG: rRNA small subunit methyltransferase 1, partial [Chloroflexi bacterium]|nr:rRNA small subunit methyltransferase 1 [Chloroflexota bacterium]